MSEKHILTAAHCFDNWPLGAVQAVYTVLLGTDHLDDSDPNNFQQYKQEVEIFQLHTHPNYTNGGFYDLAIIELEDPVTFSEGIKPIRLPKEPKPAGQRIDHSVELLGYGITGDG